ncbi:PREDICTED: vegetative cell wall protein gp1-like, partial [Cyprinodon variegatus]|uniref:vegetative cell wall protein gp1-like n=1 Tax=Cyprinodon variegatus TaxID=28743 RepID=UPI00074264D3
PGAQRDPESEGTEEGPAPEIGPPPREEERQPGETKPRAPPAAGHPEVGLGTEHRSPHGTDRNAPAPQSAETHPAPLHQSLATARNTQQQKKPPGAQPPEEQTAASATNQPTGSTKPEQSEPRRSPPDKARAAQPCPSPPLTARTSPRHTAEAPPPPRPPDARQPEPLHPPPALQPHLLRSAGTKKLHHASKWENPPKNPISTASPSTPAHKQHPRRSRPAARRQQDPHLTGPPSERTDMPISPPEKERQA